MKKPILLGTSILAILLLAGCANIPLLNKSVEKAVENAEQVKEKTTEDLGGDNQEVNNEEVAEPKEEVEASKPSEDSRTNVNDCLNGCAVLSGTGIFSKEFCIGSCWTEEAKEMKDITICDTKVDKNDALLQSGCRLNVAEASGDPKYCETIGNNSQDLMRVACYSEIAKQNKDVNICEAIKGSILYQSCIDDVNSAMGENAAQK